MRAGGFRRGWQGNQESGPYAGRALNPNLSLLSLQNALGDRQPQAFARSGLRVEAVKDLENLRLVLSGDSDAVVGNRVGGLVALDGSG